MNEKDFLTKYLWPSEPKLNMTFTLPLPEIRELKKCGDFIIQSEHEDTFMTSIMTKYESETTGIRLIEIYKNTQNKVTGVFYRMVGQMGLVKNGYPFLRFAAGIKNVNMSTGVDEDIITRFTIHLPQASPEQRKRVFRSINKQANEYGISFEEITTDRFPGFYGSVLVFEMKGIDLGVITRLRGYVWSAYIELTQETESVVPFDYKPLQELMVLKGGKIEHMALKNMGLSVPDEANTAVFSVEVCC